MGVGLAMVWALALLSLRLRNARRQTLAQLRALTPTEFEDWVGARFRELGYKVKLTGTGGDHGADLLAEKPGERAIVQCKRYRTRAVSEPALRDLYGAMHDFGVDKAYLVTTGEVTEAARRWARGKPIAICDGDDLARLARSSAPAAPQRAAASPASSSPQGGTGSDGHPAEPSLIPPAGGTVGGSPICPRCGAALVVRHNGETGEAFLGCSRFPKCWYRRPMPS